MERDHSDHGSAQICVCYNAAGPQAASSSNMGCISGGEGTLAEGHPCDCKVGLGPTVPCSHGSCLPGACRAVTPITYE